MSAPVRIPLARAERIAAQFLHLIDDACEQTAVAGSVRRQLPQVGEITVLAVPKQLQQGNLFGDDLAPRDLLIETIDRLASRKRVQPRPGERNRKVWTATRREMIFRADGGALIPLDLWWTTAEHWGVQLALRTGPAGLTYALTYRQGAVTPTGRAGLLPPDLRVREGLQRQDVGVDGEPVWIDVPTWDEWEYLQYIYTAPVPPEQRR